MMMKSFNQIKLLSKILIRIKIKIIMINNKIKKNGMRFNNKSNLNNYKNKMLILKRMMYKKVNRAKIQIKNYHKKKKIKLKN